MDIKQDATVFEAYKPLRNAIRKLDLADSLAVINAYMSHLQFQQDIAQGCEVPPNFSSAPSLPEKRRWISEFHLETLCREIILHAEESGNAQSSLRHLATLSRAIKHLNNLEGVIAQRINSPDLLMREIHRMAHRQFPWQIFRPTNRIITRYHMIHGLLGSGMSIVFWSIHEDLPGCPARKSGEEWQLVAKLR